MKVVDSDLEAELRAVLVRDDDYATAGKPICDWDDRTARGDLVAELAADAYACLGVLDGRVLDVEVCEAAELLATVVGQDLETVDDGRFRIARRVAKDRVISTVDPDARHGRKTRAHGFDGYKAHAAVDPDSEIVTDTIVTPGNTSDGTVAKDLIDDLINNDADNNDNNDEAGEGSTVYGDNAYGTGEFQQFLQDAEIDSRCKTQSTTAPGGMFPKERFAIDLTAGTVECPNGITVAIRPRNHLAGVAEFGVNCAGCPLRSHCTTSKAGRRIAIGIHEQALARARTANKTRHGVPTTGPPAPKSNANLHT